MFFVLFALSIVALVIANPASQRGRSRISLFLSLAATVVGAGTGATQEQGPRGAERPSFDCARAKTAPARLICADRELIRLDSELSSAFQTWKAQLAESDQPGFVASQLAWIGGRNARCGLDGKNGAAIEVLAQSKPCMANVIRERIIDLNSSFGRKRLDSQVAAAAPPTPSPADDPSAIVVQISAAATAANPPEITGSTNLPDGTILSISLLGDPPACTPRCGNTYPSATVEHGRFSASPLKDAESLFSGSYTIDIVTPTARVQPGNVQAVIGKSGERLRGPYVVVLGNGKEADFPVTFPRRTELSDDQKYISFMIHFRQRIRIAGDPVTDAAKRKDALAEFRKSFITSCTQIVDLSNGLVRSGPPITGREIVGAERESWIQACIADSEARLQAVLNMPQHESNIQPDAQISTSVATPAPSLGPAPGRTMPIDFIGDWCSPFRNKGTSTYMLPSWTDEGKCTDILSINKYGFHFNSDQIHCEPLNMRLGTDTAPSGTAYTATFTARCQPDGPVTAGKLRTFEFSRYKGNLTITTK